ncbi:glycerophosphodiester phosphodiesterase [Stappia sp. GBMRC 2046]|uniref:Glycerophosphodiester phosphodiesterase n=1 Tax=Stappia sediminis TaxID=2692190 RepID=A0A7X3LWQ9_9HYPH|nr:glycerophosphodiester phosphodiesterase [Stappia sediminis]MXN66551.1 glycerophosphodiester phosphodiesterase [Stappia sediminis]
MKTAAPAREALDCYRKALGFVWPLLTTYLLVRLIVLAVVVPLASLILALAIATQGRDALTDQEIAWFLFTPSGAAAALAVACLLIAGAVMDIAIMTGIIRRGEHGARGAIAFGLALIYRRSAALFGFAARLTLRILLIAVPFLGVAAAIAFFTLGQYDINYYLTYWPPDFVVAAAIIGVIVLALALVLVWRLSGWAISLHLLFLRNAPAGEVFRRSAERLAGHKRALVTAIIAWALVRGALAATVAAIAGALINILPGAFGGNLHLAASATISILLLLAAGNALLSALSNGALADLLNRIYMRVTEDEARPAADVEIFAGEPALSSPIPKIVIPAGLIAAIAGGIYLGGGLLDEIGADRTVEIIAHRGSAGIRPENTMAAVEKAMEDRADWVEIDVQETADDEVVVAHDSDFMKLAGVDMKVWDATMADIGEIDIGSWFDPAYSGERTPTLRQVLLAAKGRGKVIIELKYYGHDVDLEARVVRIVEETAMADDVAVMSLEYDGIRKMQALRPEWRYGVLAATAIGNLAGLEADFLAVNTGQVSLGLIRRAHDAGKQVYVWTVDDPVTMSRMISMGVDGLITNEPALARQVMETRNGLTAYQRLALWLSDRFRVGSFDLVAEEKDA